MTPGVRRPLILMGDPGARLIEPAEELRAEFLAMAEEYAAAGEDRYRAALEDFPAYVRGLLDGARGVNLPPGRVPSTTFWLSEGRRLIGRSSVRHRLTPDLAYEGGHIGYDIRPSERRRGYGTLILRLTLEKARESGLSGVLLTCDARNAASARVIEKNGGRPREQAVSQVSGELITRYWIEL